MLLICTVKGEGLAETQGEGLPEKIKGAALAAAPKIRISLEKKIIAAKSVAMRQYSKTHLFHYQTLPLSLCSKGADQGFLV